MVIHLKLSYVDSMLSCIDGTRMSKKFNIKVRLFPGAKTDDMFHYLVPLLEKDPEYVILHVGTNDSVDHLSNDIISKIKVPSCKVIISTPIKRHGNKKASKKYC